MEKPRPIFLVVLGVAVLAIIYMLVIKGGGDASAPPPEHATQAQPSTTDVPTSTVQTDASTSRAKRQPKPGSSSSSKPTPLSLPPSVASAMLKHRVVVALFWSPNGSVDRRVRRSVDRLRKNEPKSKIAVFYASPDEVADYSFIAGNINQAPAIVVVDRAYKTKVVEGFIDYTSVLQMVREASKVPPA